MPADGVLLGIAMLGTRGVPASYSGFETCAEELGARLAARGATVYCRVAHISPSTAYRGMRATAALATMARWGRPVSGPSLIAC